MDEIALLQQQLAAVQQQESALKLSDHNVIDLLLKLQQLGKIQIVHTLTGKQILTPLQIEREIEDQVTLHGGRVSLSVLQGVLNIDRSYVDKYVSQLAKPSKDRRRSAGRLASHYSVVNAGEEVLTNWYLDAIMEDTNALLQENGTITMGELAQQYGFGVEYMKDVVLARLGSVLHAQEKGNVLYTDSFVASQKAQVRGVFAGITRPTFLPDVIRSYRFDEKVVEDCLNELIRSQVLMGTLRGRDYVPYVFMEAQRESMYSFFQQNGYLEHARATQLQVTRPFEFLKRRFPDAVPLHDCVVSHALQLQVEASVEAAATDSAFVDLRTILPSAVNDKDIALLLSKSPCVARGAASEAFQLSDVFAVSKAFVESCLADFKKDAEAKANIAASQQRSNQTVASAPVVAQENEDEAFDDEGAGKRGGKRGKKATKEASSEGKGKRGGKAGKQQEELAESKPAKGGKGRKGKKGADTEPSNSSAGASSKRGSSGPAAVSIVPTREQAAELLMKTKSALEDEEELVDAILDHLEADLDSIYSTALATALASVFRGDASSMRELRRKFEDKFDELFSLLLVLEKGVHKLSLHVDSKDEDAMAQLQRIESHLLDTSGVELASLTTSFVAESGHLEIEDIPSLSDEKAEAAMKTLSDATKKLLEMHLAPALVSALVRMWTLATAGRRSLGDFMLHVPVMAEAVSMPLRKQDRKKERQVVFAYRHEVTAALNEEDATNDRATALALAMQLFFQQCTGLPARFPRSEQDLEVTPVVLNAFRSTLPSHVMRPLDAFVALTQQLTGEEAENTPSEWRAQLEAVRTLVQSKDMAAASDE